MSKLTWECPNDCFKQPFAINEEGTDAYCAYCGAHATPVGESELLPGVKIRLGFDPAKVKIVSGSNG